MENYLHSFEEITSVYGGFPLKTDCLQAGLEALRKEYEEDIVLVPEWKDGNICFRLAVTYYYDDDQLIDIAPDCGYDVETAEEAKALVPEDTEIVYGIDVTVRLREENGRQYIVDVNGKYCVLDHERKPIDWEIYPEEVNEDYAFSMVETFLDAAVDAR